MLIEAAIDGGRARDQHPAIPVTPEAQAAAAADAKAAGAGAVHLHVRGQSTGESLAAADVERTLEAVRAAAPGLPVGVSTGIWIVPDPRTRLDVAAGWTTLPDFASVNFDEEGAEDLARLLLARRVGVEAGLCDCRAAARLATSGLAPRCLRVLLEPQDEDLDAALGVVAGIEAALEGTAAAPPRLLHGLGATAWPLLEEAAARGYDARIGFEDCLVLPDGSPAPSNGVMVAEARRLVTAILRGELGGRVAGARRPARTQR